MIGDSRGNAADPTLDRPDAASVDGPTMVRWRAAESQLYPLIVSDPDLYQLAVAVVVEARGVLRDECSTAESLAGADAGSVLERCPTDAAAREGGFNTTRAFEAACAQRFRELTGPGGPPSGAGSAV